jgi:ATP-dependent RNA helicase DeaD
LVKSLFRFFGWAKVQEDAHAASPVVIPSKLHGGYNPPASLNRPGSSDRRLSRPGARPNMELPAQMDQTTPPGMASRSRNLNRYFGSLKVSDQIADALADVGYAAPTPIQEQAIPPFLEGRDLVAQAKTGTGKTAAFGIPLAELIDPGRKSVQAIVLAPTRELAVQVAEELTRIGKYRTLRVVAIYGGQSINPQIEALRRGVQVVVGTPGRIMDHMSRGTLDLGQVKFAVLDEADEMLDVGFADAMDYILRRTPRQRQTALFCATYPVFIKRLIHRHLHNPVWVRVGAEIETVAEVDQVYYEVAQRDKESGLREILDRQVNGGQALIFCRTQIGVDRLVRSLARLNYPVYGLHGGKTQSERNTVMQAFRGGELRILVSTNVASRGIDIPSITHVINYSIPDNLEEYIHRIGRAGRMGRQGTAITLVSEWDFDMLDLLMKNMGDRLHQSRLSVSP